MLDDFDLVVGLFHQTVHGLVLNLYMSVIDILGRLIFRIG